MPIKWCQLVLASHMGLASGQGRCPLKNIRSFSLCHKEMNLVNCIYMRINAKGIGRVSSLIRIQGSTVAAT